MVDKKVKMSSDEAIDYIRNNVKEFDRLELAYNRVFAEGDVLGLDFSEYNGVPGFRIMIAIDGEVISDAVEIDLIEFKEDIIEFYHYPKDEEKESVFVEVI